MVARASRADRVGPHLEVAAIEPRRDRPGQGKTLERQFRSHRLVDADKVGAAGLRQPLTVVSRNELDSPLDTCTEGRLKRPRESGEHSTGGVG